MPCSSLLITTALLLSLVQSQYDDLTFLGAFGYLDIDVGSGEHDGDTAPLISIPEDIKSQAVIEFQRYYGLTETGIIDAATRKAMSDPRCGVPDKDGMDDTIEDTEEEEDTIEGGTKKKKKKGKKKKTQSGGRSKRFAASSNLWNKTRLSYRFMNYTSDIPQYLTRAAFKEAFSLWEEASTLQFYEETRGSRTADIEISYIDGVHGDRSPFNPIILAHAFFPQVGWLHMNEAQTWNYNSLRGIDTVFVALHELGHILGLRHSKLNTIMHASYSGYQPDVRLSADDVAGVQALYGPNPCYPNNPCRNNGACMKEVDSRSFVCSCTSGFKGLTCQTPTRSGNKKCRALFVRHGTVHPAGKLSPNDVARVYCNSGYELLGASQFTCTFRGFYSPSAQYTRCKQNVVCPGLSLINGEVYPRGSVESQTTISFSCDDGYQISGSLRVKCKDDGTYDRSPPTCVMMVVEEEEEEESVCPTSFDALASRSVADSLIFAFKGSRYWIYKRGSTGAPVSHWTGSSPLSSGFPNIPTDLDAAFSYTDPETRERYVCMVKWPRVYYFEIISNSIRHIRDFPDTFGIPRNEQITAAYRWDRNTVYFFVPLGYYIYDIATQALNPTFVQPMSTFIGMPSSVTATGASKAFYSGIFYLFSEDDVYQIRTQDKQVLRNSPYKISALWRHGLRGC